MAMPKKKQSESHAYDFREQQSAERKRRSGKKKMVRTTIEHHDNGGHTVEHHFAQGEMMPGMSYEKPESHGFGKHEGGKMLAHLGKMLGIPHSEEEANESEHDLPDEKEG